MDPNYILREESTMDELISKKRKIFNSLALAGYDNIPQNSEIFFDNLRKCKLVKVKISAV